MKKYFTIAAFIWLAFFFTILAVGSCKHHQYSKKYDQKPKHR